MVEAMQRKLALGYCSDRLCNKQFEIHGLSFDGPTVALHNGSIIVIVSHPFVGHRHTHTHTHGLLQAFKLHRGSSSLRFSIKSKNDSRKSNWINGWFNTLQKRHKYWLSLVLSRVVLSSMSVSKNAGFGLHQWLTHLHEICPCKSTKIFSTTLASAT